jgi:hypothetical protein
MLKARFVRVILLINTFSALSYTLGAPRKW